MKIWLDDIRPCPEGHVWALDYDDFVYLVVKYGLPEHVNLDHDLGHDWKTGYAACKFMVEYHMKHPETPWPTWSIHSANPVGSENMRGLLENYEKHIQNNKSNILGDHIRLGD